MNKILFAILFILFQNLNANSKLDLSYLNASIENLNLSNVSPTCSHFKKKCPSFIDEISRDESLSRALVLDPRDKICKETFESSFKNKTSIHSQSTNEFLNFLKNNSDFSQVAKNTYKNCPQLQDAFKLSKIQYFERRIQGGLNVLYERSQLISTILDEKIECPAQQIFPMTNESCLNHKCTEFDNKSYLEEQKNIYSDYKTLRQELKKQTQTCSRQKDCSGLQKLQLSLLSLEESHPWLNQFYNEKVADLQFENKYKSYLKKHQNKINETIQTLQNNQKCLYKNDSCNIDEFHEMVNMTPSLPDIYNKDPLQNKAHRFDQLHQCLEESTLDRNQTGKVLNETYLNMGLTMASLGIGSIATLSKSVAQLAWFKNVQRSTEILNTSVDAFFTIQSVKDTISACQSEISKITPNDPKGSCNSKSIFQNTDQVQQSKCLIQVGMSAIAGGATSLGLRSQLVLANFKSSSSPISRQLESELKPSLERRQSSAKPIVPDRRSNQASLVMTNPLQDAQSYRPTTFQLDSQYKIHSKVHPDGFKSYYVESPVTTLNGDRVSQVREIQLDNISGGLNANFSTTRTFFEQLTKDNAGKAHFAFIDVGSLGAVNKNFKTGSDGGDRYLKAVADKIKLFGKDQVTIARLGGDEFGIIIHEKDPIKAQALLDKIRESIRKDLSADAHQVFREEKISRAETFRKQKLEIEKNQGHPLSEEQLSELRQPIDELAKIQQPDISIGITEIGYKDDLAQILSRAEDQAKEMKIQTTLNFGRSAEKYGSDAIPRARPNPLFQAEVKSPISSPSWNSKPADYVTPTSSTTSRFIDVYKMEELKRVGPMSLSRYMDENGVTTFKIQKYIDTNNAKKSSQGSTKQLMEVEIPLRGETQLLDGTHPVSQDFISNHFLSSQSGSLVMPKLKSLRYLNYFEDGTAAGDTVLQVAAEVLNKSTRKEDLIFKMNGADFLWSTGTMSPTDLKLIRDRLNTEIMGHPKVIQLLSKEKSALEQKLVIATSKKDQKEIERLKSRLNIVLQFKPDLDFRAISQGEAKASESTEEFLKKLDEKFK